MLGHAGGGLRERRVGFDFFAQRLGGHSPAEHVRDVTEMAERAGEMALEDRPVLVGDLPATNDVDEVLHVAITADEFLHHFAGLVVGGGLEIIRRDDGAPLALDDVTDADATIVIHRRATAVALLALGGGVGCLGPGLVADSGGHGGFGFRRQPAYFENQRRARIVVNHDLRVRCVGIVHVAEPTADADGAARETRLAEEPARNVHLVDALVAHVAVAGDVVPMPVIVEFRAAQLSHRCRAGPKIVVHGRRDFLRALGLANTVAALVAKTARGGDFP